MSSQFDSITLSADEQSATRSPTMGNRSKRTRLNLSSLVHPRLTRCDDLPITFTRDGERRFAHKLSWAPLWEATSDEAWSQATCDVVHHSILDHITNIVFYMDDHVCGTLNYLWGRGNEALTNPLLLGYDTSVREALIDTWESDFRCAVDLLCDVFYLQDPGLPNCFEITNHTHSFNNGRLEIKQEEKNVEGDGPCLDGEGGPYSAHKAATDLRRLYQAIILHEVFSRCQLNVQGCCFKRTGLLRFGHLPIITVPDNAQPPMSKKGNGGS